MLEHFYAKWNYELDRKIYASLLKIWQDNVSDKYTPQEIKYVKNKFNGDYETYTEGVFAKSIFTNKERLLSILDSYSKGKSKKIKKDLLYKMAIEMKELNVKLIYANFKKPQIPFAKNHSLYVKAVMEFSKYKACYPDANSTFRIAYGNVKGYEEKDGVYHTSMTSFDGLIEKSKQGVHDWVAPKKLKQIYDNKNYGKYAVNGKVPMCFLASNHTTGGNSGSPVINAEGQLIGGNFDRAWKGVFSDFYYNPDICRNISLDIRFVLFLLDKYVGAQNIIDEMTLVSE